jgi:hypothetical protein
MKISGPQRERLQPAAHLQRVLVYGSALQLACYRSNTDTSLRTQVLYSPLLLQWRCFGQCYSLSP